MMGWLTFRTTPALPAPEPRPSSTPSGPSTTETELPKAELRLPKTTPLERTMPRPEPKAAAMSAKAPSFSLDSIGQRNEVVRQRISEMADRLEEVKSLQDHFTSILEPLSAITDELPHASMRIAELEALLAQEQQAGLAARREAIELASRVSAIGNDLAQARSRLDRSDTDLGVKDGTIEELRIALRDKSLASDNFERQLFAESEQAKALLGECKALRAEAHAADQALSRVDHELTGARERINLFDQENRRLQLLSEDQSVKLVELGARHEELIATSTADREKLRLLETQLAAEIATREKNEMHYESIVSSQRTERAALEMKLEAAVNRLNSTEQMLTQFRNQLREKDDAGRIAERSFKEAQIEKLTAERRLEGVQAELGRQTERFLEMQRLRVELDSRCDMLTKALAAKDAGLEQATSRNAALADRIDQMTRKHEVERTELDTANRRLLEELQTERSERVMAQGALNIARESRLSLQKQHDLLKRSGRGWNSEATPDAAATEADSPPPAPTEPDSNVRPFTVSGKPN